MEIKITAVHFDASTQLNDFIQKRVEKLQKFNDAILKVEVTMKLIKPETAHNKEILLRVFIPGNELVVTKVSDMFEDALRTACESIERKLEKSKEK